MQKSPIVQIVKKVVPAVVSVGISKYFTVFESPLGASGLEGFFMIPRGKKKIKVGGGSGFIVNPSGIILTNRHVVIDPKAEYVVILNNGKKFKAEVLARDSINDVAILKIKAKNLSTIGLGDSSGLELGQTAIAIGNTLGTFQNTVSVGVISGLSREIVAGDAISRKVTRLKNLVQTDAAINPGNSGGPLIDISGKAIGINAAMVFGAENVGFALPINIAKKDLEDLAKYGRIRQPFLGIRYILINKNLQKKFNLPANYGALVISEMIPISPAVIPGSPAYKAGLQEGDIILSLENTKITEKNRLEDVLQKFKVGKIISLKVLRGKKEMMFKITLGERK